MLLRSEELLSTLSRLDQPGEILSVRSSPSVLGGEESQDLGRLESISTALCSWLTSEAASNLRAASPACAQLYVRNCLADAISFEALKPTLEDLPHLKELPRRNHTSRAPEVLPAGMEC